MTSIHHLKCLCGAKVTANDETQTLTHEGQECDQFREMVKRINSGNPYVANPQTVEPNEEDREVTIMTSRLAPDQIFETARCFGIHANDVRAAAKLILREMRARGYVIRWPNPS